MTSPIWWGLFLFSVRLEIHSSDNSRGYSRGYSRAKMTSKSLSNALSNSTIFFDIFEDFCLFSADKEKTRKPLYFQRLASSFSLVEISGIEPLTS